TDARAKTRDSPRRNTDLRLNTRIRDGSPTSQRFAPALARSSLLEDPTFAKLEWRTPGLVLDKGHESNPQPDRHCDGDCRAAAAGPVAIVIWLRATRPAGNLTLGDAGEDMRRLPTPGRPDGLREVESWNLLGTGAVPLVAITC